MCKINFFFFRKWDANFAEIIAFAGENDVSRDGVRTNGFSLAYRKRRMGGRISRKAYEERGISLNRALLVRSLIYGGTS